MVAAIGAAVASRSALAGDVDFAADDWLDPVLDRRVMELNGTEQIPVIGQGDCRHSELDRPRDHRLDLVGTVEEAEVTVKMEVDKLTHVREPILFPFNGARGFGADVVDDPVNSPNFIDDPV